MVKKPSQQAGQRPNVTPEAADALANKLADKGYGDEARAEPDTLSRSTISLPTSLLRAVEDLALKNKRSKRQPNSVSGVVRDALAIYFADKS